jgi:hypothetical protein
MTLQDKRWHTEGNCNNHPDPDLWHYENSVHADEQQLQVLRSVEAISLCRSCPVKELCLKEGLEPENLEPWGGWGTIWGGFLLSERYQLLKRTDNERIVTSEQRHRGNVRKITSKVRL